MSDSPVDRLTRFFGIDRAQLVAIIRTKRLIDSRWQTKDDEKVVIQRFVSPFQLQLIFMVLAGPVVAAGLFFEDYLSAMTFTFTLFMMISGLLFFSHFMSAILELRDYHVVLPRPVNAPTILLARLIHSVKSIGSLVLCFSVFTIVAVLFKQGLLAALAFAVSAALVVLFLQAVVQLILIIASRFSGPERFQHVIMFFLIAFSAFCMVTLSLYVNRYSGFGSIADLKSANITGDWMRFYPPAWFAGLAVEGAGQGVPLSTILAWKAVVVSIGVCLTTLVFTARQYRSMLDKFSSVSRLHRSMFHGPGWGLLFGSRSTSGSWRAMFALVRRLMTSDNGFKLLVYPTLGTVCAFALLFIYDKHGFSVSYIEHSFAFYFFIYSVSAVMATAITNIQYSKQYDAAWFYSIAPVEHPGHLICAAVDAYVLRFILPLNLFVIAVVAALWGASLIVDCALAGVVGVLACVLQGNRMRSLPFSTNIYAQPNPLLIVLDYYIVLIPILILVGMHVYLNIAFGRPAVVIAIGILTVITAYFYRKIWNKRWSEITRHNDDHVSWTETTDH